MQEQHQKVDQINYFITFVHTNLLTAFTTLAVHIYTYYNLRSLYNLILIAGAGAVTYKRELGCVLDTMFANTINNNR